MEMRLEYLKEMPKAATPMRLDLTTLLDALFFTWTVQLLLPVSLFKFFHDDLLSSSGGAKIRLRPTMIADYLNLL